MQLTSNGGGDGSNYQSDWRKPIIGRDLMPELRLQLVQKTPGERVMEIHAEGEYAEGESNLDQWQDYFSKQFSKLFNGTVNTKL